MFERLIWQKVRRILVALVNDLCFGHVVSGHVDSFSFITQD